MGNSHQVTIKDIARELNISPSTVSRALKDHPDISKDTKKAVSDLAKKYNYQPNAIALSLRSRKTNTIGVVVPQIVHFFFSNVISGIEDIAYDKGYNVMVCQTNELQEREEKSVQALLASRVDGLLVSLSKETKTYDHLRKVTDGGTPMVFFDRKSDDFDVSSVVIDDYQGGYQATEHLAKQGYKKIAHLAGPLNLTLSKSRYAGYQQALKDYGLDYRRDYVIECANGTIEEGYEKTKPLLDLRDKPDAVFAANDPAAIGALKAIKDSGLKVPQDIGVIGFSDWQLASLVEPALSSISQPGYEMGAEAARLMFKALEAEKGEEVEKENIVLKTNVISRESTHKK
ncbi:LacI family DNA-binding transcriptional regulator [Mangrovivirga cuniculi]|uniref:LacI family transcriptional regulator n=1 Tax=Mangrovivirga cuniculi TaxID=2715131 RepID=A0A4D7K274_9BACT|nr:LacI family DNA-binding transcriptional regulator [Mangrovivirga cuniculi]QCK14984.1 LacI family transcriptional regulator [Mangrovivirga cuniculi]